MDAVINAALPLFALILAGYLAGAYALFDAGATDTLNRFAFYFALPALIFAAMSKVTPGQLGEVGFAAAVGGGIAITYALGFAIARLRGLPLADGSLYALDGCYGNTGFMGVPLCLLVFGPESLPAAVISMLFTACVLFLFGIMMIEAGLQKHAGAQGVGVRVARALLRNPLFVAPIAGLMIGLTGLALPVPVERFASLLGAAASPCALFCIGLFLAQIRMGRAHVPAIGTLVALKLFVLPAVTAFLALGVFQMPKLWSSAAILLSALPIGSGPFTIAKTYGLDAGATAGAILASHALCVATVSLIIAWLA